MSSNPHAWTIISCLPDPNDNKARIISHYEKDLFIAVKHELPDLNEQDIAFYAKGEKGQEVYFVVLHRNLDPEFTKWSEDLFFEAIGLYFEEIYQQQPEHIQVLNDFAFYPYQKGLEEGTDAIVTQLDFDDL